MSTKALVLAATLLAAGVAHAITITRTETRADDVVVCIRRTSGNPTVIVAFKTYDATGLVRDIGGVDVWNDLTPTLRTQAGSIVNAIYNAVHTRESIPTPTPAQ